MPDFVTHHLFGKTVAFTMTKDHTLPKQVMHISCTYPTAFAWGLQGPDPMFYHRILLGGSSLNDAAHNMHYYYTGQLFEEMLLAIQSAPLSCQSILLSYFCGFVCHYALDANVHPYVYYWQKEIRSINPDLAASGAHAYIESSIDAALYKKVTGRSVTAFDIKKQYSLPRGAEKCHCMAACYRIA